MVPTKQTAPKSTGGWGPQNCWPLELPGKALPLPVGWRNPSSTGLLVQKSMEIFLQMLPFQRLVKDTAQDFKTDLRLQSEVFGGLQEASGTFLMDLFEDSNLCVSYTRSHYPPLRHPVGLLHTWRELKWRQFLWHFVVNSVKFKKNFFKSLVNHLSFELKLYLCLIFSLVAFIISSAPWFA